MKRLFAKLSVALMVLFTLAIPFPSAGQTTEPDQTSPPGISPPTAPTSAPPQPPATSPIPHPASSVGRPVSWKLLLPNLISDQERIWTFPARLVQGQNWVSTTAVLGTTA